MNRSSDWKQQGAKNGLSSHAAYQEVHSSGGFDVGSVQAPSDKNNSKYSCKCCAFWCILVTAILLLVFFLLLFFVFIPNLAQSTTNTSTMTVLSVHLSNATNDSVLMNASMQLSNTGSYDAKIKSATAQAYLTDGSYVGTLKLPDIHAKANKGGVFHVNAPLMIHNVTNFQKFTKLLLTGKDSTLVFEAKPTLDVTIAGISVATKVTMKKRMTLSGSSMENSVSSNFTVTSAETDKLVGLSAISFSTATSLSFDFLNVKIELYDSSNVYIGYSIMPSLSIVPGYNSLDKLPTYIDRITSTSEEGGVDNSKNIELFISNFMMGINQEMIIYGPVPYESDNKLKKKTISSVIDYCLNSTILSLGSTAGDTILNGIMTAESQTGWKVTQGNKTIDIRGAYSTIMNPLNVDTRLVSSVVDLYLWEEIEYGFDKKVIGFYDLLIGNCSKTNKFARVSTGYGMYKHEPNKTWVDIPANGVESFFVIGQPIDGQYGYNTPNETDCNILGLVEEEYPCCFLFETLAAICRDNPGLMNSTSDELKEDFIKMRLESNMTLLIDSSFQVDLTYNQAFFPIYYGKSVYSGFVSDLFVDCPDISFPGV